MVETPSAGVVRRRRPLPGGRAALGGLLVAVAAVGTFVAASGATADPRQSYVVARDDLAVGQRIERDDLAVGRMDLPDFVRARAYPAEEADSIVGSVVLGPVARGELVQRSSVRQGAPEGRQVSFPIDPARAVGGQLQHGEFVDVLATVNDKTTAVVRSARIASVKSRGGFGGDASLIVTLDVPTAEAAVAVANALDTGELVLVRSGPPK